MKVFSASKPSKRQGERASVSSKKKRGISLSNQRTQEKIKINTQVLLEKKNVQNKSQFVEKFIIYDMNRQQWQRSRLQRSLELKTENYQPSPIKMLSNHSVITQRTSIYKPDQQSSLQGHKHQSNDWTSTRTQQEGRQSQRMEDMQNRMKLIEKRLEVLKKAYCQ